MTARPAKKKSASRAPRQPEKPERTDIRTIARLANVSIATVSRTINGVTTVDPKLARRVWDVVQKLDFVPNTQARALVSGRSKILGLLISEITNPFFPELMQGFEDIAVENGYEILVSSTNHDPQRMSHCIRRMLERKVEGVAIMTFGIEEPLLDQFAKRKVPMVFIDQGPDRAGISVLKIDYHHGIRQAVQHLAALGHRSIAFVSGPHHLHSAQSRLAAYTKSMQECGIQPLAEHIVEGNHTLEGGTAGMAKLLALDTMPTAVVCSNDLTAIGVLHKLYRTGVRVPDDISVIGFDDIHIAEVTMPPLTTVQMSRNDIARAAFEALRTQVESPESTKAPREYNISTQLIVRESTGFPRGTMTHLRKKA